MAIVTRSTSFVPKGWYYRFFNGVLTTQGEEAVGWEYSSRTGEVRKKPTAQFIAPTAYSATFYNGNWTACRNGRSYSVRPSGIPVLWLGALTFNGQWSNVSVVSSDTATENRAILNARSRVKDSKVNLAVAFAERKQTANLFVDVARRVSTAIDAAKHLNPRGIKRALGIDRRVTKKEKRTLSRFEQSRKGKDDYATAASELWLANAYGVRPLLSDVKGAAEALAKKDMDVPDRYRMTAIGKAMTTLRPNADQTAALPSGGTGYIHRNYLLKIGCKVRLDCKLTNPALAQAAALGLTNPAVVLWEKLPWSFVIDWLLPVGDYLNSMDATLGWDFLAGSKSLRVEGSIKQVMTVHSQDSFHDVSVSAAGSYSYKNLNRSVLATFPFPSKFLPKNPLSMGHVANALALLRSRYH